MFKYEKIPDLKLTKIVNLNNSKIFKSMPKTLLEFCHAVENDDYFYMHHTHLHLGSKTVQSFREQIYSFLENIDAVEYSIEDSLHNACIPSPLAITFQRKYPIDSDHIWKIKDIPELYDLQSGKLWLPPHHQAKLNQFGKIPENISEVLRSYIKYVLKCKDKNINELLKELETLESVGILTEDFYKKLNKQDEFNLANTLFQKQ